jgi:hypothetical protein
VPALISVEFRFYRFPSRRPNGSIIVDVKIFPVIIDWNIIVPEAGNPPETRVLKKTVPSASIRYQAEKVIVA